MSDKWRVLIVDDHVLVRDGLRALLESSMSDLEIVSMASSGEEALEALEVLQVDLILLDISMNGMNGIDFLRKIKPRFPAVLAIIISMYDNREYALSARQAGARGYVLKESPIEEMIMAIRAVCMGGYYYSAAIAEKLNHTTVQTSLTKKEREVLILLAEGYSNLNAALKLGVSERTIETHRFNLQKKLMIYNVAGLLRYAIEQGWLTI